MIVNINDWKLGRLEKLGKNLAQNENCHEVTNISEVTYQMIKEKTLTSVTKKSAIQKSLERALERDW